jgi:hypothetical protein
MLQGVERADAGMLALPAVGPGGELYILDDGSDVAVVRLQDESPDLWIVDRFSGDGGSHRCALARRRWPPRAAITVHRHMGQP